MNNITALIVAMKEEAKPFIEGLELLDVTEDSSPFAVYKNESLILIVSGVGELNAALAAQYAILNYGAETLYSTGSCGATGNRFHVGQVVSVEKVYKRDVDLTCFGYEKYQLPGTEVFLTLPTDPLYETAVCFSSDEFVTSLTQEVPADVIVEMEAFSVAYAAKKYGVAAYVYKVVSDLTDQNTDHSEFAENLETVSAHLAEHIISLLKK